MEGELEVVGECGCYTGDKKSEGTWENRRRGRDVVRGRRGGIRNEI